MFTPSQACIQLIKTSEGCSLKPYKDLNGFWTGGWGHRFQGDDPVTALTQNQADLLFDDDLTTRAEALNTLCAGLSLTQGQFDALLSFDYNFGLPSLKDSTLFRKLKAGDLAGAALEFGRWVYAGGEVQPGLVKRRAAEAELFNS